MQIPNLTFTRTHDRAAIGAVFLIAVIGLYNWVVRPHVTLLVASQRYEQAATRRIETGLAVNEEVRQKQQELQGLLAQRAAWSQMTFDVTGAEEFLRHLQEPCNEAGCRLISLSYLPAERLKARAAPSSADSDEAETPPPVTSLLARGALITVHGPYRSVVRFVGLLQSHSKKVWIDRCQMTSLQADTENVACELVITIYVTMGKEMEHDE